MNQEVEIKVIIKNPVETASRLKKVATFIKERKQVDVYYSPADSYYNKPIINIVEYLRVRHEDGKNHLNYSYCHQDEHKNFISTDEYEVTVNDPDTAELILEKIGMKKAFEIQKVRQYYEKDGFEILLDHVEGLGDFLEIEAKADYGGVDEAKQQCKKQLASLGVEYEEREGLGYPDMMIAKQFPMN